MSVVFASKSCKNSITSCLATETRMQSASQGRDAEENYSEQQAGTDTGLALPTLTSQESLYFLLRRARQWRWKKLRKSTMFSHHSYINSTNCWFKGQPVFCFQQSQARLKQFDSEEYFLCSIVLFSSISALVVFPKIKPVLWCQWKIEKWYPCKWRGFKVKLGITLISWSL